MKRILFVFSVLASLTAAQDRRNETNATIPTAAPSVAAPTGASPSAAAPTAATPSAASPSAAAPTTGGSNPVCLLCGDATFVVTVFNITIPTPNGEFTCAELLQGGLAGLVPESSCSLLQSLSSTCGCQAAAASTNAPSVAATTPAPTVTMTTPAPTVTPVAAPTAVTSNSTSVPTASPVSVTSTSAPTATTATATPTAAPANATGNYTTCYLCGTADAEITITDLVIPTPDGNFTCKELFDFGLGGMVSEDKCTDLQGLLETCGCQGTAPVCYLCGDATSVVTSNDTTIQTPNGVLSCEELYLAGLGGFVPEGSCSLLQTIGSSCGCQAGVSTPTASPGNSSSGNAGYPACFLCTAEDAQVTNPDVVVSTSLGSFSCAELDAAGKDSMVSEDQCLDLQVFFEVCGCLGSASVCNLCGSDTSVITNNETSIPTPYGDFTCRTLFVAGLRGLAPEGSCGLLQTVAGPDCGCQDSVTSTPAPTPAPTAAQDAATNPPTSGATTLHLMTGTFLMIVSSWFGLM